MLFFPTVKLTDAEMIVEATNGAACGVSGERIFRPENMSDGEVFLLP
jgi:hypothetical protein